MDKATRLILTAVMEADRNITPRERVYVLAFLDGETPDLGDPMPAIMTRKEVARLLGKTVKRVDQIASAGYLKRVPVPGSRRALGYTEESVRAVLEGRAEQAGQEVQG